MRAPAAVIAETAWHDGLVVAAAAIFGTINMYADGFFFSHSAGVPRQVELRFWGASVELDNLHR